MRNPSNAGQGSKLRVSAVAHPSGKYAFTANYAGGTVAVLPIRANGELGPATDVKRDTGQTRSTHAASAPTGSFAISGHDRPHAHMIQSDPSGRSPGCETASGDGLRHFTFHQNGRWLYCLQDE